MKREIGFDVIIRDFGLTRKQDAEIINLVHSLARDGLTRKRIYNEITTRGYNTKQLQFAFLVMGFYEALVMLGAIIE